MNPFIQELLSNSTNFLKSRSEKIDFSSEPSLKYEELRTEVQSMLKEMWYDNF